MLDSADMIDIRLRLRGWTYGEPARRRLRSSPSSGGLDLTANLWVGDWWGSAAAQAGRMSCRIVHLHYLGRAHNLGLKSFN